MVTQRLQAQRDLTVLLQGSPPFFHVFGAIAATEDEYVEMATTFPRSRGYAPLMSLLVSNDSGARVDLEINGRRYTRIAAGVILNVTNQAVWSFRITNVDTPAVAAGEITANVETPPMGADQAARVNLARGLRRR